jgi:chromosome segregation ATPase
MEYGMKKYILVLSIISSLPAFAAPGHKVDDLDTEVEAEQLDVYEQRKMEDAARLEAIAFEKQAKKLEGQIKNLREESGTISKRLDNQGDKFKRIYKLAGEAERKAKAMELQRNQLKAKSEVLQGRVEQAQSRLSSAEDLQRSMAKEIRDQQSEQRDLSQRLKAADTRIQRAQAAIKNLRKQQRRLSDNNQRMSQKVSARVARAEKLEEQSLENDL